MQANRNAPVFSEGEIEIAAPTEEVWDPMAGIERWPQWNLTAVAERQRSS